MAQTILNLKYTRKKNVFWKEALKIYKILTKINIPTSSEDVGLTYLWHNPDIQVGGTGICFKRWLAAGVVFLGDVIKDNGEIYTYKDLINVYNIQTIFLEFNGLLSSIKQYLRMNQFVTKKQQYPVLPLPLSTILKNDKGCSNIYKTLVKNNVTPTSLEKWKNDLTKHINENINYGAIYEHVFKITKEHSLIWFQYRINHRILGTNYLLSKMKIKNNDRCTFCKQNPETLLHLFWNCKTSKQF